MLNVPTLFERNPKTRTVVNEYIPLNASYFHQWQAMERMPGADVRVTVRRGSVVRLEVINKPTTEQRAVGIIDPWYQDCPNSGANIWLHAAVENTDFSAVPDGEWPGEAIGENIMHNPLGIEGHTVLLSSLFPWREIIPGVPVPPPIERTPFEYDDLRYWLGKTESIYAKKPGVPLDGVVWWWQDTPVAQVRARDFGRSITKPPNPEAQIPPPTIES